MTLKCKCNYHDDLHPEICYFEVTLDEYLIDDSLLTSDAIQLRDAFIIGVERMYKKVQDFKHKNIS